MPKKVLECPGKVLEFYVVGTVGTLISILVVVQHDLFYLSIIITSLPTQHIYVITLIAPLVCTILVTACDIASTI